MPATSGTSHGGAGISWLRRWHRRVRAPVASAIVCGVASGMLLIVQAVLLARVARAVIFDGEGLAQLRWELAAMAIIIAMRALLVYIGQQAAFAAGRGVRSQVRDELSQCLAETSLPWRRTRRAGELASTLSDGVDALQLYYARYLPQAALAGLIPPTILAVVVPLDWVSALVLALTAPLIPVFMVFIGRGAEKLNQRQWRRMGVLTGHFLDALRGLTTLRIFNLGAREARLIARLSDEYRIATLRVLRLAFVSSLALEFLATMGIAMVAVLVGFRLLWGSMDFEAGLLVLLLAPEFYLPLRNLGTAYHARMEAIGATEGMLALLDAPRMRWAGTHDHAGQAPCSSAPRIELQDVGFAYPDGTMALKGLNLVIDAGQTLAITGVSGAGKSTLALLLLGLLVPGKGRVLVDGVDRTRMGRERWFAQLAWVPQQPHLFHGSVRDNLALGNPAIGDAALRKALAQAQALDFVQALPQGLDNAIGERGQRLSGGQAQRLAIARALLANAPVVVVDEGSAHLDQPGERALMRALGELGRGRTLVVIAHRLATVRNADRIVVLEGGRLVETGSHDELLARGGRYARMYEPGRS